MIDQTTRRLGVDTEECFFWATHAGAELDLLIVRGINRIGFEVKRTSSPRLTPSMRNVVEGLKLKHLYVIHAGEKTFPMATNILAVALGNILIDIQPISQSIQA